MCVCVCACLCSCVRLNEGRKNEAKVLLILFLFVLFPCFLKEDEFFFLLQILKVHAGRKYLPLFLRLSFEIIRKV